MEKKRITKEELYEFIEKLKIHKMCYLGSDMKKAQLDVWRVQKAEDDDADTDLYMCSFMSKNIGVVRFNVLADRDTDIITDIDLTDVDIYIGNVVYDAVNLENDADILSLVRNLNKD